MDVWNIIHLLGAAQGMLMGIVFLFHKHGNRTANRFLGLLMIVFSLRLLELVAFWSDFIRDVPHFYLATYSFPYLFGVLFYLYIKQVTVGEQRLGKTTWPHFLPFVICVVYLIPFYALPPETKLQILESQVYGVAGITSAATLPQMIFYVLKFPHVLIYLLLSIRALGVYTAEAKSTTQLYHESRLRWLRGLIIGFGFLFTLWIIFGIGRNLGLSSNQLVGYIVTLATTILIYAVGYLAFRLPEVFQDYAREQNRPKYEGSTLTPEAAHQYLAQLKELMHTEKLYRKSELKFQDLAQRLNISSHLLSQVINEYEKQSFFDFVNHYRIDEAKQLLTNPKYSHYSLLGIAYEVGFNNKTSFNTFFKKLTGRTPSEFRKEFQM